jgi:hypothetical protein
MTGRHLDASLVAAVYAVQFEYLRGRMNAVRAVRGDPEATQYFEAEHLRACVAPGIPNPFFNQIFVFGPVAPRDVESALALFEQHGMEPKFEFGPGALSPELAAVLAGRGFLHTRLDPLLIHSAE